MQTRLFLVWFCFLSRDVTRLSPVLYREYCIEDGHLVPRFSLLPVEESTLFFAFSFDFRADSAKIERRSVTSRYHGSTISSLTNSRGSRVAGPMSRSRDQCRGRGSKVAVAGRKSRSRVQCRGRGSNVAAGENDLKTTDMKTIWREKIFFVHDTLR